jgi:hypothetical protein
MNYVTEMGPVAMICILTYRRSEFNRADTRTDTQRGNLIHLLLFFQSKEIMSTSASLVRFITHLLQAAEKTVRHGTSFLLV